MKCAAYETNLIFMHNTVHVSFYVTWEWEEEGKWPQLGFGGRTDHACAVLNSKLFVTGGWTGGRWDELDEEYRDHTLADITLILDLTGGPGTRWVEGARLHSARYGHVMVTMGLAGQERLFVIGGSEKWSMVQCTLLRLNNWIYH